MSAKRLTKADLDRMAVIVNQIYCNPPITDGGWFVLEIVADDLHADHELRLHVKS